jgi:hypothetical protein
LSLASLVYWLIDQAAYLHQRAEHPNLARSLLYLHSPAAACKTDMDYAISLERCDCTICGIQLDPMSYRDPDDGQAPTNWYPELWKQDNVVLSGPHSCRHHKGPSYETVPDKAVTCEAAEAYSSKTLPAMYFRFKPGFVVPQSEDHTLGAADEGYYIAVHVACLRLAETVIGRSPDAHIHSLGQLWHSLERRCTKTGQAQLSSWPGHVDGPFLPSIPEDPPQDRPASGPVKLGLSRYFVNSWLVLGTGHSLDDWEEEVSPGDPWVSEMLSRCHPQSLTTMRL